MIFLSYASEDRHRVEPFFDLIKNAGFDPWMDVKNIVGGQNWDYEIKTALDRAELVVVFVSKNSVDKRGYAQREIKAAIDKYNEKLINDIYIIPIQLDAGDYPFLLKGIQFINADNGDVNAELLKSIAAASRANDNLALEEQTGTEVRWFLRESTSTYDGIPGYETKIEKISISSHVYLNISDIAEHINGQLVGMAMGAREDVLSPDPENFNLMQDKWRRTHTFDAIFGSARVVGRAFSLNYSLHWYMAGAAHPVHAPKTFSYLLQPTIFLDNPRSLFCEEGALQVLQDEVKSSLVSELGGNEDDYVDTGWIEEGLGDWNSFSSFEFFEDGIRFQFSSYQVACYAAGMPSAFVPYERLTPYFSEALLHALGLNR